MSHVSRKLDVARILEMQKKSGLKSGIEGDENAENRKEAIEMHPSEAIFKDVEPGQIYQMKVQIQNKTRNRKRIRVFQPKSNLFRCDYELTESIAAGLSIDLVISFEGREKGEFSDTIKILTDNDKVYELSLLAFSPMAKIIFEPVLSLGFIQVGSRKEERICFKNEGTISGKVELSVGDIPNLMIEPLKGFVLAPNEKKYLAVGYNAEEAGIFRGCIEVACSGKSFANSIEISATCVEFMQFLIDKTGKEIESINFGDVTFGKKSKSYGFLVNNSPEQLYFKFNLIKGVHEKVKKESEILTPQEVGLEKTMQIFKVTPSSGYIESYSQIPVIFSCSRPVDEDHLIWSNNFNLAKGDFKGDIVSHDKYTCAMIFSQGLEKQPFENLNRIIPLSATGVCPKIFFSSSVANFMPCPIGEQREECIFVKNQGSGSATLAFPILSHFKVIPSSLKIGPGEKKDLLVKFTPKNLGKIKIEASIMLNKVYPINFLFEGVAIPQPSKIMKSLVMKRNKSHKLMSSQIDIAQSHRELNLNKASLKTLNFPNKFEYLRESRQKRAATHRESKLNKKLNLLESRVEESKAKIALAAVKIGTKLNPLAKIDDIFLKLDLEAMLSDSRNGLEAPQLELPKADTNLFVTKPIGEYEPVQLDKNIILNFETLGVIKPYPSKPPPYSSISRDINVELTGEMLTRIPVGPKVLEYGKVFINSHTTKYFYIKNTLKGAIQAKIEEEETDCLDNSESNIQIIPSGSTACFPISYFAQNLGNHSFHVAYKLNERSQFKILVNAEVLKVEVILSHTRLELNFENDELSLQTKRTLTIRNPGNAYAEYEWIWDSTTFDIIPKSGVVKPLETVESTIVYTPDGKRMLENEFPQLIIKDGIEQVIEVVGSVSDTDCSLTPKAIDFESLAVGEKKEIFLTITNNSHHSAAVYFIDTSGLPTWLKLSKSSGRIPSNSNDRICLTFSSNDASTYKYNLEIKLRGGKRLILPIDADVIIPNVIVYEEEFNFGTITYGNMESKELNIENTSPILARIKLDLRSTSAHFVEGYECLTVEQILENDTDSVIMIEAEPSEDEITDEQPKAIDVNKIMNEDDLSDRNSYSSGDISQDSIKLIEDDEDRYFVLTLKPGQIYKFRLTFEPKNTINYAFFLPLFFTNSIDSSPELRRKIFANVIPPKLMLDPIDGRLNFGKIIIPHLEETIPVIKELEIKNPDNFNSLNFFINTDNILKDHVFTLSKTEGTVPPGKSLMIEITFKPHIPGKWRFSLPVYLDSDRENKKAEIHVVGEGDNPKILFDRRQIVMPVVPLDVESKCFFRVINDGYNTVTLKALVTDESIPIKLNFFQGNRLGKKMTKMKVEVTFTSKKPVSFTTRIDFEDDYDTTFSIYCSGTADNCLLTNWLYFLRPHEYNGEITIGDADKGPIKLVIPDIEETSSDGKVSYYALSGGQSRLSQFSREEQANLGYDPVPFDLLRSYSKTLTFWLKGLIPTLALTEFPRDIIFENGNQLLTILEYFTNSAYSAPFEVIEDEKKEDRSNRMYEFYRQIIEQLTEQGAFLSDIRPEYLMRYSDVHTFYRTHPSSIAHAIATKIKEGPFSYISAVSWCVLISQIMKLFYLGRVTLKKFKGLKLLEPKRKVIPKAQLYNSNIYSHNEVILLRWAELALEDIRKQEKRLVKFDEDFKNGIAIGSLIQFYTDDSIKPLNTMKDNILSHEDLEANMHSIRSALLHLGAHPVPSTSDLTEQNSLQRLMLMTNLFLSLPSFVPRDVIEFECVLGETVVKTIGLNNTSKNRILYSVKLEGSGDFSIKEDSISLDPGQKKEFVVRFESRITEAVYARLSFKGDRDVVSGGVPLVYDLVSHISGRRSVDLFEIDDTPLYETKFEDVTILNPFNKDAIFAVMIDNLESSEMKSESKKSSTSLFRDKQSKKDRARLIPAFFSSVGKIHVPANKTSKLKIKYLPTTFRIHTANLILIDQRVGELQYDLVGVPQHPKVKEPVIINSSMDSAQIHYFPLSLSYQAKSSAFDQLVRETVLFPDEVKLLVKDYAQRNPESLKFKVDGVHSDKDITFPNYCTLFDRTRLSTVAGKGNEFKVVTAFKFPVKDYNTLFMLRNEDLTDVRIYELRITLLPKPIKAQIEFDTTAGCQIYQEIPVINPLQSDVQFTIDKKDELNGKDFEVPKLINIGAEGTGLVRVDFKPEWIGKALSELTITNSITLEKFVYKLRGVCTEPLSEDHFSFTCKIGEKLVHFIDINNPTKADITYNVEIDIDGVIGDEQVIIKPQTSRKYQLIINPQIGGIFAGSITFREQGSVRYLWYSMEMEAQGVKSSRDYQFSSVIRKESILEIPLENNTRENVEYSVRVVGDAIFGPDSIYVSAFSNENYLLRFLPFEIGVSEGHVIFHNPKIGEIACKITLHGHEEKAKKLPLFSCPIGMSDSIRIELYNPYPKKTKVKPIISNTDCFAVEEEMIEIQPNSKGFATIIYTPHEVDFEDTGEVEMISNNIGGWKFNLFGKGTEPGAYPEVLINALLNKETTKSLTFASPLKTNIIINIKLEEDRKSQGIFSLRYTNSHKLQLKPGQLTNVTISFIPLEIREYRCKVHLELNDKLSWTFPIRVVTEADIPAKELSISTVCRNTKKIDLTLSLPGLASMHEDDEFEVNISKVEDYDADVVREWTHIEQSFIKFDPVECTVNFEVAFSPQKPFKARGELTIARKTGGIWK